MKQIVISLLFLFIPYISLATELKPWFGNEYESELRVSILYQNYNTLSTPDRHDAKHRSDDTFTTLSIAYPFKRYSGEFEVTGAHTRHQSHCIDNYKVTGRYLWMNELDGDDINLVTSLVLDQPQTRAFNDVSSFHHGHVEGEFCVSIGKKYGFPCTENYLFRWWNVFGIGTAEEGSPWYRANAAWEYKHDEVHQIQGFVHILIGTGKNNLHPHPFRGYGSIRHQSIDLGFRYIVTLGRWGSLNFEYGRRVYAFNFPKHVNLLLFEYYLPFGHQVSTNY